jgi:hypothetical protein
MTILATSPPDNDDPGPVDAPEAPVCEIFPFDLSGYSDWAEALADGWQVFDPEGVLLVSLSTDEVLTSSKSIKVVYNHHPSGDSYFWAIAKATQGGDPPLMAGATYVTTFSRYPVPTPDYEFSTLEGQWTEVVDETFEPGPDGEGAFGISRTMNNNGLGWTFPEESPDSPTSYFDRLRIVTPACLDEANETPDDPPGNTAGLLFHDDFEETA